MKYLDFVQLLFRPHILLKLSFVQGLWFIIWYDIRSNYILYRKCLRLACDSYHTTEAKFAEILSSLKLKKQVKLKDRFINEK